jgi:hypothetical protein
VSFRPIRLVEAAGVAAVVCLFTLPADASRSCAQADPTRECSSRDACRYTEELVRARTLGNLAASKRLQSKALAQTEGRFPWLNGTTTSDRAVEPFRALVAEAKTSALSAAPPSCSPRVRSAAARQTDARCQTYAPSDAETSLCSEFEAAAAAREAVHERACLLDRQGRGVRSRPNATPLERAALEDVLAYDAEVRLLDDERRTSFKACMGTRPGSPNVGRTAIDEAQRLTALRGRR